MNTKSFLPIAKTTPLFRRAGSRRLPLCTCAAVMALAGAAHAGQFYWFGDNNAFWNQTTGPGGTNWSSSGDFNQGTTAIPGAGDDVYFNLAGAGNLTTQLGADFSIRSLNFTPDAASPIIIGGNNTLTLGIGGVTDNGAAAVTVSSAVALGASQTWTNNTANAYTQSGIVSGANSLTIAGSGNFRFTNANSYSGATSIFTGSLTLSGAGSVLNTSGISLGAGTTLTLDSSGTQNANRIGNTTAITSSGGIISLIGNAAGTVETAGTLGVASGASVVQTTGTGSGLVFGAAGTLASTNRTRGGSVLFAAAPGSTVSLPNVALSNGIIGGWAVTGTAAGTGLDFATIDAGGNVVPFTAYTALAADTAGNITTAISAADNLKYDATGNNTARIQVNTTVNSLYLTGSSPLSGVTGGPTNVSNFNGITFGSGITANTTLTLTIGAGGIIASGVPAASVGHYNNKADVPSMAFIGYQFGEFTGTSQTNGDAGRITAGAGLADLVVYTDSNLRIASNIIDNGAPLGLTKSGPGILDLSNGNTQTNKPVNSFTGKVTINEGILLINAAGQLGSSAAASDNVTFNGGELRTFAGLNTNAVQGWTVGTRGGTFTYTGGSNSIIQNKITGVGGFTYYARQTGGGGGNTATIHLGNSQSAGVANHDYQGATNFNFSYSDGNAGASDTTTENIIFDINDQVPHASAVNINTVKDNAAREITPNLANKGLNMNGKTQFFGSLAGNVNLDNHNGALTLGANNLSTVYTGAFSAGSGSVTKVGSGTQTFSGANFYTGVTNINGGGLLIGAGIGITSATSSLANTIVTVGNGTLSGALGGNGTIGGAVTVTSTGHLAPAMSSSTFNTLTLTNDLTINPGGTLDYNFGAPGTGDLVDLTGAGSLNILGGTAGQDVLNITQLAGFGIGIYNLIVVDGTGLFADSATFTINGKPNFNYSVLKPGDVINPTAGGGTVPLGRLVLQVVAGNPRITWVGNVNGNWDVNTTANWAGDDTVFKNGSNVAFDDAGAARPAVTVTAAGVSANSITLSNGAVNYTIGGGAITVTAGAGITKGQAGNVTFNSNVTTPITTITAGTLTVGAAATYNSTAKVDLNAGALVVNGTLATPALNVKAGATLSVPLGGALGSATALDVRGTANFSNANQTLASLTGTSTGVLNLNGAIGINSGSYDGVISGAGGLSKLGTGLLALTNALNNFIGVVAVKNGTLSVPIFAPSGSAQPLGAGLGDITLGDVGSAGLLQYTGNAATFNRGITLAGAGSIETTAAGQTLTVSGIISNGTRPLSLLGAGDGVIGSPLAGSGNIVKQDAGTWTLSGTGAVSGATASTIYDVQAGALALVSNGINSTLGAGVATLSGGSLRFSSTAPATFDNTITVSQDATLSALQATGGTANQTVTVGGTRNVTVAAARTLTLATANGYTMNLAGNLTGAGGIISTGTVNLNGAANNYAGPTTVSGGVFSVNGGLNTVGAATVSSGTFNANVPITVSSLTVSGGTYNGAAALTSAGGVTVSGGTARISVASGGLGAGPVNVTKGILQFDAGAGNSAAYTGSKITNDGLLHVKSGTADLGNTIIATTVPHATPGLAGQLAERYFRPDDAGVANFTVAATADPLIFLENTPSLLTRNPGAAGTLDFIDLTFTGAQIQTRANAVAPNFFAGTDNEAAAWVGKLHVGGLNLPAGPVSFSTNSDDGSTIYVDLNQDGLFQANERVVSNPGSHGVIVVTNTVTLGAGDYQFAIGWYNGTGGAQIDAKFAAGAAIPAASQIFINPGSPAQEGIFSSPATPGGSVRIEAGATLSAGGFTADAIDFAAGTNAGTFILKNNAAPVVSTADSISVQGINGQGTMDLGLNNTANVVALNLGTGGTFSKSGAGVLILTGAGTGTGTVNLTSGPLIVNGSISGAVNVNGGTLGGKGTVGPLKVLAGGTLAPGGTGTGLINTGAFDLSAPTAHFALELDGTGKYDQASVTGSVLLGGDLLATLISGYRGGVNDTFYVIFNDGVDAVGGTFSNAVNNGNGTGTITYGSGLKFLVNYSADAATSNFTIGSGNDVAIQMLVVPEPSAALSLLSGAALLGLRRRR